MNKSNGFTLIELMIVVAIVGILAAIATGSYHSLNDKYVSHGINGSVEARCIDGFKFVIGSGGNAQQIMDSTGSGVRCDEASIGVQRR